MTTQLTNSRHVALRDPVTERVFGPVFDSSDHAEDFLAWLRSPRGAGLDVDAKHVDSNELERLHGIWRSERCDKDGYLRLNG